MLFSSSIADNIAYGSSGHLGMEDIEDAAKKANVYHFIRGLPHRFDTLVGERGIALSGKGQPGTHI